MALLPFPLYEAEPLFHISADNSTLDDSEHVLPSPPSSDGGVTENLCKNVYFYALSGHDFLWKAFCYLLVHSLKTVTLMMLVK